MKNRWAILDIFANLAVGVVFLGAIVWRAWAIGLAYFVVFWLKLFSRVYDQHHSGGREELEPVDFHDGTSA